MGCGKGLIHLPRAEQGRPPDESFSFQDSSALIRDFCKIGMLQFQIVWMIPISNFFGLKKNHVFILVLIDIPTNAGGLKDESQTEINVLSSARNKNTES